MVSTDARLATDVGAKILASGGNAIDAVVAVAFAAAVVYPTAGNIGGGGFMVYRDAAGSTWALDFRETAPAAASRDMYLDPMTKAPTDASVTGALAAATPGSVAGLWMAHERFGKLDWREVLAPAIALANDGFTVDEGLAGGLKRLQARMSKFPSSASLFYPDGQPWAVGAVVKNPALGAVLKRIATQGPAGFYEGATADLIVAQMKRSGGIITHEDLRGYKAKFREPIRISYRGHEVITMPPPSSGGLVMALLLRSLAARDVEGLGWHSPAHIHLVAELMRHGFARRNRYLGDPDYVSIERNRFDSSDAVQEVAAAFDPKRATSSSDVTSAGSGSQGPHTTNFSVVDGDGNAVALTTTINTSYGSALVVDGAGFLLNNEMDDFAAAPGRPNAYGLVQGETNAISPGRRPLSSMSPTIVVDPNGKVRLVTGAAGGPTIITAAFHIVSNVVDFNMDVQTAVAAPRFHHQHLPDKLFVEEGATDAATAKTLADMGHELATYRFALGDAPSVGRRDDRWLGAIEVRRVGAAAAGPSTVER